jgi:hypothetical protein
MVCANENIIKLYYCENFNLIAEKRGFVNEDCCLLGCCAV